MKTKIITPARIKSLREYQGWSQTELAEKSGVGQSYISRLEDGDAPNVSGVILGRIATALETTVDFLLGRIDNPSPYPSTNHPLLKDPDIHRLLECCETLDPGGRQALIGIAERMSGLPPTRPFEPRPLDKD